MKLIPALGLCFVHTPERQLTTLLRRGSCYQFKQLSFEAQIRSFQIQVAKATHGQKNGSAEESEY